MLYVIYDTVFRSSLVHQRRLKEKSSKQGEINPIQLNTAKRLTNVMMGVKVKIFMLFLLQKVGQVMLKL